MRTLCLCVVANYQQEDKIYENPADESHATELWRNSSLWLKVEKLMFIHIDIIKEMKSHLKELADLDDPSDEWLGSIPDEFEKLSNLIQEDLVKPTANLSDLVRTVTHCNLQSFMASITLI